MRVLIVDDSRDVSHLVSVLVGHYGHETKATTVPRAALDIAKDWQPEVVFVDLAMPGMNGYDVASQFRAAGFTSTKIIALSGHQEDRERGENAGIDGHILKPISMVKIKSLLGDAR